MSDPFWEAVDPGRAERREKRSKPKKPKRPSRAWDEATDDPGIPMAVLDELEATLINPGVRELVAFLVERGWQTCDSGDVATHDFECDRPYPYVVVQVEAAEVLVAADTIADQLNEAGVQLEPACGRTVQANYCPIDGRAFVEVIGVTDADLAMG